MLQQTFGRAYLLWSSCKRPDLAFCSNVFVLAWGQTTCWNDSKFVSLLSNTMMIISTKFGHKWTTARSTCCTTAPTGQKVFVLWCGQHTGHLDLKLGTASSYTSVSLHTEFQLIWTKLACTSFTKSFAGQKLWEFIVLCWLRHLGSNLVQHHDIVWRKGTKSLGGNGETKITLPL